MTTTLLESTETARAKPSYRRHALRRHLAYPLPWIVLGIVVLGALTSEYYLTAQNMQDLARNMTILGLLGLGMTPVLLTGRIDLSVGATMIFSVIAALQIMILLGDVTHIRMTAPGGVFLGPKLPFMAIAILVGAGVGLVNGIGVAYGKIAPFIMTLAMLTGLRGLNYVITNGHPYYIQSPGYGWIGNAILFGVPASFLVYVVILLAFAWIIGQTVLGRRLYAIGGDERTARYSGVHIARWIVLVYVASGICAATVGVLFTSRMQSVDASLGVGYEMTAIAIAVVGGTTLSGGRGSPYRTFCGGAVLAAGLNLLTLWGVGSWTQNIIVSIVLIGAVALTELRFGGISGRLTS